MRFLIVEEALRAGNGHWPRYIADLAGGFRAEGDSVVVLGHKEANEKVTAVVEGVVPWLSRDCRVDRRSQGLLGGIRHNLTLKKELEAWLKMHEYYDWVLSLSSRPKHLLAFAQLARMRRYAGSRFLLLFVLGPGQRDGAGSFRISASNLFVKFCFALLKPAVLRGQVVLAAETQGMQKEIECFTGLPVKLFPHPVEVPAELEQKLEKKIEPLITLIDTDNEEEAVLGLASQAGASEPDSLTSKLADSPVSKSPIRSAAGPASALRADDGAIGTGGGNQLADSTGFFRDQSQAGLQMGFQKHPNIREANAHDTPRESSSSVSISVIRGEKKSDSLDHPLSAIRYRPSATAKPILVVAPGLARYEKGSDILQEAIKLILKNDVASEKWRVASGGEEKAEIRYQKPEDRRSEIGDRGLQKSSKHVPCYVTMSGRAVKFVMQWPEDFDMPDGSRCGPDPSLLDDERVEYCKDLLTGDSYLDFLRRGDLIVLPYRIESYRARVSRVAIEAAMMAKPMVYTKGSWIKEVADLAGCGVEVSEETAEALACALETAMADFEKLRSTAESGSERVRDFYNVASFRKLL